MWYLVTIPSTQWHTLDSGSFWVSWGIGDTVWDVLCGVLLSCEYLVWWIDSEL